jgi:mono/diheme cytochrome c family protein
VPAASPLVCHARRIDSPALCRALAAGDYSADVVRRLSTGELTPGVPAPDLIVPLPPADPAEAARLRRAGKPRVEKGCGVCHGKVSPPADPPT